MTGFAPPEKRKGAPRNDSGITAPGCLLVLLVVLLLGFVGYKVGEAYWTRYQVREQVREVLIWAAAGQAKGDIEIAQKVISAVGDAGLQVSGRNVRVTHATTTLTITVRWTHDLDFSYYVYPLPMEVSLTEVKRWGRGGLVIK
jgi:hypothetical protein